MLGAAAASGQGYTGKGITIGIVDTGVDVEHWELKGRIANPTSAGDARLSEGQINQSSHGTGVGGVIVGSTIAAPASLSINLVRREIRLGVTVTIEVGVIVGSTITVAASLNADLLRRDTTGIAPDARLYVHPIPLGPPSSGAGPTCLPLPVQ